MEGFEPVWVRILREHALRMWKVSRRSACQQPVGPSVFPGRSSIRIQWSQIHPNDWCNWESEFNFGDLEAILKLSIIYNSAFVKGKDSRLEVWNLDPLYGSCTSSSHGYADCHRLFHCFRWAFKHLISRESLRAKVPIFFLTFAPHSALELGKCGGPKVTGSHELERVGQESGQP